MRIICGTDFSIHSTEAANVAALLAASHGDSLLLLHSCERPVPTDAQMDESAGDLKREADRLRKWNDITVKEVLVSGAPYEKLIEFGNSKSARMIVVSSLGKIAPSRFLLGSVAERTAEAAPIPTLVVRNPRPFNLWLAKKRPLKVLIGFDFSATSEAAVLWTRELSRLGPVELLVGSIIWTPRERLRLGNQTGETFDEGDPAIEAQVEKELKGRMESLLGKSDVKVRVQSSWGRSDYLLIDLAAREKADLVVLGTHQRQGFRRLWEGSVSRSILREAPTNVAIVPTHAAPSGPAPVVRRILVSTDLSKLGNRAIPFAYSLLHSGGTVCVLHAVSKKSPGNLDRIRAQISSLAASMEKEGIQTLVEVVKQDDAATAICQAAERFGADLICISSHGRTGLAKTVLGSVAQSVLEQTRRPVMIVKEPAE